jgi:hypothetical protein
VLAVLVAALAHHVPKKNGALRGIDQIGRGLFSQG